MCNPISQVGRRTEKGIDIQTEGEGVREREREEKRGEERRETLENERMVSQRGKTYMMRTRAVACERAREPGKREGEDKGKRTLKMRKVCER